MISYIQFKDDDFISIESFFIYRGLKKFGYNIKKVQSVSEIENFNCPIYGTASFLNDIFQKLHIPTPTIFDPYNLSTYFPHFLNINKISYKILSKYSLYIADGIICKIFNTDGDWSYSPCKNTINEFLKHYGRHSPKSYVLNVGVCFPKNKYEFRTDVLLSIDDGISMKNHGLDEETFTSLYLMRWNQIFYKPFNNDIWSNWSI
jgi:hypothetical protein